MFSQRTGLKTRHYKTLLLPNTPASEGGRYNILLLPLRLASESQPYNPLLFYQAGPVISFGRVKIHGPFAVTAMVCSKCAEGLPSAVSAVHSSRIRTSGRPAFTIGSTAITIPSCNRAPRPGSP